MANIIGLRRRINAAQNVSKTTRAMQMIAASKLKRAQNATLASRPYVEKLTMLNKKLSAKVEKDFSHPYLAQKEKDGPSLLIVLSPDKGLCGGLITNLMREYFRYKDANKNISYIVIGKKGEGQVARVEKDIVASFTFGTITPSFNMIYPIVKLIDDYYLSGKVDVVRVLYTHFTSIFSQTATTTTLLPIPQPEETSKATKDSYIFEPTVSELLPSLLRHYVEMNVYQFLLESFVSEQAARMIAMQNATNNANDIIEDLRLEYNKSRQAKITSEILDISGSGVTAR